MKPQEFIETQMNLALDAQSLTGVDYRVVLAQWALETGWGGSTLAQKHNNLAGIKFTGSFGTGTPQGFASYKDLGEFLLDYVRVMNLSYYARVRVGRTPEEQIAALQASPYDENHYPQLPAVYHQHVASLGPKETGGS